MLKNAGIKVYSNLIAMLHTGSQSSGSIHPAMERLWSEGPIGFTARSQGQRGNYHSGRGNYHSGRS